MRSHKNVSDGYNITHKAKFTDSLVQILGADKKDKILEFIEKHDLIDNDVETFKYQFEN